MHLYFHGIFSVPRFVRLLYSFFVPSLDFVHSSFHPTKFASFKYISTGNSSRDPFGGVSSCDPFGMVLGDLQRRDKTVTNGTWNWWLLKHIFFRGYFSTGDFWSKTNSFCEFFLLALKICWGTLAGQELRSWEMDAFFWEQREMGIGPFFWNRKSEVPSGKLT